ncbi:MAG: DUF4270 family protein [Bacteroidota bacterium]
MTKTYLTIFFLLTIIFSCKKKSEDSVLGLDIQPEQDLLGVIVTDTASLYMHTQKVESVKSYNDQFKFLGSTLDPVYGRTDASIYTNLSIANNLTNLTFGTNPILDSAEIVLRWLGESIGDTSTVLTYDVYVVKEKILPTNSSLGQNNFTNTTLLKATTPVAHINAKYRIRGDGLCLVLPLDYSMAQYILQTNSNLINNAAFLDANKGFYITSENSILNAPTEGAIRRFDLDDILSGANFYYHESGEAKTFQFTFKGTDAARFNNINHNYVAGANPNLFDQLSGDLKKGEKNVYLNCFGGTRTRVTLPYLNNFAANQNVSISRAELILKVDESFYNANYNYPSTLALLADSSGSGREELVYDQLETTDFIKYNGNYDAVNKQYVFNIARQVQKIITNKIQNYGFYIVNAQPDKSVVIRRDDRLYGVTLGGTSNTAFKPVFKIAYVNFPYDK